MRSGRDLVRRLFDSGSAPVRPRAIALLAFLIVANLGAWAWALAAFGGNPALLGTAFLAYGFGLRHAIDADHIAAIDGVTRKLLERSNYPVGIGFFFSLGHSTIVVLATIAIVFAATFSRRHLDAIHGLGGIAGTAISAAFLFAVAVANLRIFIAGRRSLRDIRYGRGRPMAAPEEMPKGGGVLAWVLRPVLGLIGRSWQMYPVGLLFGLGFDTATEIGLLGISAVEMANGLPTASIFVFPALFTAGMSLVDTADGIAMLSVYKWAFVDPVRKLTYNLTVTLLSALAALIVGGIELLGLLGDSSSAGPMSAAIRLANTHFAGLGLLIVGLFISCWLAALLTHRLRGADSLDVAAPAS